MAAPSTPPPVRTAAGPAGPAGGPGVERPTFTASFTPVAVGLLVVGLAAWRAGPDRQVRAVVLVAVATLSLAGVIWPLVVARSWRCRVTSPHDTRVGLLAPLHVAVEGRGRTVEVRVLDPAGPWYRAAVPFEGDLPHLAATRGVFTAVRVEVRTTGLPGLVSVRATFLVPLGHEVHVAPAPLPESFRAEARPSDSADPVPSTGVHPGGDEIRSLRPYRPGDPAHLVHWPSTAHLGEPVVRELEPPLRPAVAVVVDLQGPGPLAERAAGRAAGLVADALAKGATVLLCTCEPSGPVAGEVTGALAAGRRLARAVPGSPAEPGEGWTVRRLAAEPVVV